MFKAHRLLYHSILGLRVIKKKKKCGVCARGQQGVGREAWGSPDPQLTLNPNSHSHSHSHCTRKEEEKCAVDPRRARV